MDYKRLLVYIRGTQHNSFCVGLSVLPNLVSLSETGSHLRECANFLVVVRADSQVSAQVQSISEGVDESGMVTLKAIRSARNVLGICFVALALCSSGSL